MSLIDESRQAFRELRSVMPSTLTFNGLPKVGISHSITVKRMQRLQGYDVEATSEFELEDTDFADLVEAGLEDRVSKVTVNDEELVYMQRDSHPNSATVHLFLSAAR